MMLGHSHRNEFFVHYAFGMRELISVRGRPFRFAVQVVNRAANEGLGRTTEMSPGETQGWARSTRRPRGPCDGSLL